MLSPAGFESMSVLTRRADELGLMPEHIVKWIVGLPAFYLADPKDINLPPVKCDPVVIQFIDDVPVFFETHSWVLTLDRLRAASASIDERQANDYRTGQFLLVPEGDEQFQHLSEGELQFLSQLEGRILTVEQEAADTLPTFASSLKKQRFADKAERDKAYNTWLDTFPGRKPT